MLTRMIVKVVSETFAPERRLADERFYLLRQRQAAIFQ